MLISAGIDIVDISRIKNSVLKWKGRFLSRVFTHAEIAYSENRPFVYQHLAARFAAKEAVLKAFGKGWGNGIAWTDIEVVNEESGKPNIKLNGYIKKMKEQMQVDDIAVSLSHTRTCAIASVILLSKANALHP